MESTANTSLKPDLAARFFWEFNYDKIDWSAAYLSVIARIIERGGDHEITEIIRYYGKEKVIHALESEILYLPDYAIDRACDLFNLQKEELVCYKRKSSRPNHWI